MSLRRSSLRRSKPRPRRDGPSPEQLHREALTALLRPRERRICALAHHGGCRGVLQADHVIEKQRLKQAYGVIERAGRDAALRAEPIEHPLLLLTLDEVIADGRNGWMLCERHHSLKTSRLLVPEWEEIPRRVDVFAALVGFEWLEDTREYRLVAPQQPQE